MNTVRNDGLPAVKNFGSDQVKLFYNRHALVKMIDLPDRLVGKEKVELDKKRMQ
jgi:hypothetical protein